MKKEKKITAAIKKAHGWLDEVFLIPVKIYRKYLSPLKSTPTCRFTPSCSAYAIEAVREWGIIAGLILAVIRIIRCNPFSRGGEDPVPSRKEFFDRVKRLFQREK